MTATVMLFDPTASRVAIPSVMQRTMPGLAGKVVGFIENTKPNFDHLAAEIGALLVARHAVARVLKHQKRNASVPAAPDLYASFADQCDIVISGSGD